MKKKTVVCDICYKDIVYRGGIGYKLKKKEYFLDTTYHNMDVCKNCMWKIIKAIRENKGE